MQSIMPTTSPQASSVPASRWPNKWQALAVMVLILLVVFASRVMRLPGLNMQKDEVWSVWQTLGTLQETMLWTPYDWSPLSYVLMHIWQAFTGISPFGLRVMTVLLMLLCDALIYRLALNLVGRRAALLTVMAFSAFGYILFLSTIYRPYMLNLVLFALAMILVQRYFQRPSKSRGMVLALVLITMFYVHITAVFAFIWLGIYTLIAFPPMRSTLRRWWLPVMLVLIACLPEVLRKLSVIGIKNKLVEQLPYQSPPLHIFNHYLDYAGQQAVLWAALLLVATTLLLEHVRFQLNRRWLVLIVWMLMPIAIYWLALRIDAFNPRHIPWVMLGFAVWIGWGLSLLPRAALVAVMLVLLVANFDYIPLRERYETFRRVPLVTAFDGLRRYARNGDVILVDPQCKGCPGQDNEEWDYFVRAYFPYGLTFITTDQLVPPLRYQRVWFVSADGQAEQPIVDQLLATRAPTYQVGEADLRFTLYEAPPNPDGVLFENHMRFHGAEFLTSGGSAMAWHEGDIVRVRLWWAIDAPPPLDYSVAVLAWGNQGEGVLARTDSAPQVISGPVETSRWQVGRFYVEERTLRLPNPMTTGYYPMMLAVYHYANPQPIHAPGVNVDGLLPIGQIFIKSL